MGWERFEDLAYGAQRQSDTEPLRRRRREPRARRHAASVPAASGGPADGTPPATSFTSWTEASPYAYSPGGNVLWFNPNYAAGATATVNASDPQTGVAYVTWPSGPALWSPAGGNSVVGAPPAYTRAYTWAVGASGGTVNATATNGAAPPLTTGANVPFVVNADNTPPTGPGGAAATVLRDLGLDDLVRRDPQLQQPGALQRRRIGLPDEPAAHRAQRRLDGRQPGLRRLWRLDDGHHGRRGRQHEHRESGWRAHRRTVRPVPDRHLRPGRQRARPHRAGLPRLRQHRTHRGVDLHARHQPAVPARRRLDDLRERQPVGQLHPQHAAGRHRLRHPGRAVPDRVARLRTGRRPRCRRSGTPGRTARSTPGPPEPATPTARRSSRAIGWA